MKKIVVLSLFDGMSCGQIALNQASIEIEKYYASEIDKYAIQVCNANYPDTIYLGSIEDWKSWNIEQPDIIIGGSPCQGFSFAGKGLNFDDPRSKLFFTFIDILKHYKPKYFLLENVQMAKEHNDVISGILGDIYPECVDQSELFRTGRLEPIKINSALVSAQNRVRLYWTNIKGIEQPEDKGIFLKDIIESGEAPKNKSYCVTASIASGIDKRDIAGKQGKRQVIKCGAFRGRNPENPKSRESGINTEQQLEIRKDEKTNTLTSVQKDNVIVYNRCMQIGQANLNGHDYVKRVYSPNGKSPNLCSGTGGNHEPKISTDNITWRKLTPLECERLQTVPDNYTNHVSNTQRYKMLGNGWTVSVIEHILKQINKEKKCQT